MKLSKRERLISQGMISFIIKRGVFGWGITTAILYTAITYLWGNGVNTDYLSSTDFIKGLVISLILFPIVGVLYGVVMWRLFNKPERM